MAPPRAAPKPEVTRDIQAHPIFTNEELLAFRSIGLNQLIDHGDDRILENAVAKIQEAIIYRETKDGPTQADHAAAQRAARAQAIEPGGARENR